MKDGSAGKANIIICIGATGSGKSSRIKSEIARQKTAKLIVWDMMREYGGECAVVKTLGDLVAAVRAATYRVAFEPSFDDKARAKQFDIFCKIAFECKGASVLVEELANVTKPSYAPAGWRQLNTMGRHRGITIYGTSQRPALCDKTTMSQATRLWCGNLSYHHDVRSMALMLGVPDADITALEPLQYIEGNRETKTIERGSLRGGSAGVASKSTTKREKS